MGCLRKVPQAYHTGVGDVSAPDGRQEDRNEHYPIGVKDIGLRHLTRARHFDAQVVSEQQIGRLAAQRGYPRTLIRQRLRAATSVCI